MKTIISYERSTGAGARHGTQFQSEDGEWHFVGSVAHSQHTGRAKGFEIWEMAAFDGIIIREYHRSNSGTERIVAGRVLDSARTEPV